MHPHEPNISFLACGSASVLFGDYEKIMVKVLRDEKLRQENLRISACRGQAQM